MKRGLQFLFLLLAATAFAYAPAPKVFSPGPHQLQVSAAHPSGQFTTNATSWFTNNAAGETITNLYSSAGMVTRRIWKNAAGTATNRTQILYWDSKERLYQVLDYDSAQNGYLWKADYDGFDRRLRTRWYATTNGYTQIYGVTPKTITQHYDPLVEFLELGVVVDGVATWKLYGPDLDGTYGGLNGTGGLDAVAPGLNDFRPTISDARGNVLGATTNGVMAWTAARVTGYGAVPGYRQLPLGHGGDVVTASAWRGRPLDITTFVNLGARPYNPENGAFESFDPRWNSRDVNGYSFAGGDAINYFDADGRIGKQQFKDRTIGRVYESAGAVETAWKSAVGFYGIVRHPVQTAEGLWNAATHPMQTYDAITDALGDTIYQYDESRQGRGDDPYYHYRVQGALKFEAALTVLTGGAGQVKNVRYLDDVGRLGRSLEKITPDAPTLTKVDPPRNPSVTRIQNKLALYPQVVDPRTGRNIPFPSSVDDLVPPGRRASWGAKERGEFISEWYRGGYETPRGGWENYDIHHIKPREFGGGNDFWNLVPVERQTHQNLFNSFWREFNGL